MKRKTQRQEWMEQYSALIGIDWADENHFFHLEEVDSGDIWADELPQTPEAIEAWASATRQRCGDRPIAICVEQKKGALIAGLMKYDFIDLYPLNPKKLKRYREAFTTSGAVDDPTDAELLWSYLHTHGHEMKAWRPDTVETRLLTELTGDRRKEVNERTRHVSQLEIRLKTFNPLVLELIGGPLYSSLACKLLSRWPTLEALQKARPSSLRKLFFRHTKRSEESIHELIGKIKEATPLTSDRALVESGGLKVQQLVTRVEALNQSIEAYDKKIEEVMDEHPEAEFYQALPGAGAVMAPRLLVAMGTDRERWESPEEIQTFHGVAPVTERSGKRKNWVHWRWACPKFLRQTWHEFADHSRKHCDWAKAFYEMKKAGGMRHHAALRALAYKWIRILFQCQKNQTPYEETKYLESLRKHGSPVIDYMRANSISDKKTSY